MSDIYRALSDPHRRKILQLLATSEHTQSEIVAEFQISQPAIKKHLNILLEESLIQERREGKYRYYRVNQAVFEQSYQQVKAEMEMILDNKLTKLKHFLEEENEKND